MELEQFIQLFCGIGTTNDGDEVAQFRNAFDPGVIEFLRSHGAKNIEKRQREE